MALTTDGISHQILAKKWGIILEAQDFVLGLEDGKNRFTRHITELSKAFALSVPSLPAMRDKRRSCFFSSSKGETYKI